MAATATRLTASPNFDEGNSLDTSMDDFERHEHSPALSIPSQHSGFRSSDESMSEAEDEEEASNGPWSPPAWKDSAREWYRHQPYSQHQPRASKSASASRSRETSHESYESALEEEGDDTTRPADIPLPRCSESPAKELLPPILKRSSSSPKPLPKLEEDHEHDLSPHPEAKPIDELSDQTDGNNNCERPLRTVPRLIFSLT